MNTKLLVYAGCGVLALTLLSTGEAQTKWRLPVSIQVLKDVPAETTQSGKQQRGVLYVSERRQEAFTIKKGQRFSMIKIGSEGGCRIRFDNKEYDLSSCPWLDGFTDHQEDVFKVVSEAGQHGSSPASEQ